MLHQDLKDYAGALQYIRTLSFYEAESNLKQYGKSLLGELPVETTQLLKGFQAVVAPPPLFVSLTCNLQICARNINPQ